MSFLNYKRHISKDSIVEGHLEEAIDNWLLPMQMPTPQLRVSSFPYCGILDLLAHFSPEMGSLSYKGQFYVNIGTTVHSIWQLAMSNCQQGKYAFGNWKCLACQKSTKEACFRPKKCPFCKEKNALWEYIELEFRYGKLSGHLDYLTKQDGKWIAWELKTTSQFAIRKGSGLPYVKHPHQIETYCTLLRLLYDIHVDRYAIVYTSRETPSLRKPLIFPFTDAIYKRRKRFIQQAIKSRTLVNQLLASDKASEPLIEELVELRPCHSLKDYKNSMAAHFDGPFTEQDICPYLDAGYCGRESVKKMERLLLKRTRAYHES